MFGHAISKGVDIDDNDYPDIAIGSPNIEEVYIYRSYPVVRIKANISQTNVWLRTDKQFTIEICWQMFLTSKNYSKKYGNEISGFTAL